MDHDTEIKLFVAAILLTLFAIAGLTSSSAKSTPQTVGRLHTVEDGRAWAASVNWTCTVKGHLSGDVVLCNDNVPVRLLLVDAPELEDGWVGTESRDYLARLLPIGTAARIELDRRAEDQYGRVLAYLYRPDGWMVNELLTRRGAAIYLPSEENMLRSKSVRSGMRAAKQEHVGLWRYPAFVCFADGRPAKVCRTLSGGAGAHPPAAAVSSRPARAPS